MIDRDAFYLWITEHPRGGCADCERDRGNLLIELHNIIETRNLNMKFKKPIILATFAVAIVCCVSNATLAGTIAYWRFEGDGTITPSAGDLLQDSAGKTAINTLGILGFDSSGNGNNIYAWTLGGGCGFSYQNNVPAATVPQTGAANNFSVQNTSWWPSITTWSAGAAPTGTDLQTITPAAWTIQASFNSNDLGGNHTFVGRDGTGAGKSAPLYFSTRGNQLWIEYTDVGGVNHQLADLTNTLVTGTWYNVAAVSDGTTLSLYNNGTLVNSMPLTGTSSDTSLSKQGDDLSWSVGRGWWGGNDVDRWIGFVDEVKIDNTALSQSELLAVPEPSTFILLTLAGAFGIIFARDRK
jgi:hypothetical protein